MKKAFFAICAILPGGFLFLAMMLFFTSCAYTRYNQKTGERVVTGFGTIMEIAAAEQMQAGAEAIRAEADCIRKYGSQCYYSGYGFAPPEELAWKQFLSQRNGSATGSQKSPDDLREIKKSIIQIKNSQQLLIKAMRAK